jgi:thiamine biosynthesis lipoprotein
VGTLGAGLVGIAGSRWPVYSFRPERFVERWSWAMGQPVHVMLFATSDDHGLEACAAALAELRRVESRLSLFDDASDLCELNRRAGRQPISIDNDLRIVLEHALAFRRVTGDGFNAAVEPLMRAWGFHRARNTAPSAAEISEAYEAVVHAEVRLEGTTARLVTAHTQLDFGGIAVGYGIDRALAIIEQQGIRSAFIDVSGDCAALGTPPGEPGWRVDISDPRSSGGRIATVRLRDAALATSANTAERLRYGSLVVGHVLNPETGRPANALLQASVVASQAIAADALSTAMFVTGKRPPGVMEAYAVCV